MNQPSLSKSFTKPHSPATNPRIFPFQRVDPIPCVRSAALSLYKFMALRVHPLCIQLCYFLCLSLVGVLLLTMIPPKDLTAVDTPNLLDLFFTSVSAATVSSMSTVEMEFFSNAQLVVLTILMLIGGEVFTSMLGIHLREVELDQKDRSDKLADPGAVPDVVLGQVELGLTAAPPGLPDRKPFKFYVEEENFNFSQKISDEISGSGETPNVLEAGGDHGKIPPRATEDVLRPRAGKYLGFVVLGYLLVVHLTGTSLVLLYLNTDGRAKDVLRRKRIPLLTFSVFSVVSSFSNCGLIPTNENMLVFREQSGLLLIISLVILSGNTLFPPFLRSAVWGLSRFTKKPVLEYILRNHRDEMAYGHSLSPRRCVFLVITVVGFVVVQFILFCSMQWGSDALMGMNTYQKLVGALFMSVNSRHAGEFVVDLSTLSSAVLVLYVLMMYLPPCTTFMPVVENDRGAHSVNQDDQGKTRWALKVRSLVISPLSYLVVFTILICITERRKLSDDPLNFNVLNIVVEVVSAYGNVGFTTGYSCRRQVKPESGCRDMSYGFAGWWTVGGKLILVCVMFFGRLIKSFSMKGGKAWILI